MRKAWERTLICAPEDEAALIEGVEQMGLPPGTVRIVARSLVPSGTAYLANDDLLDTIPLGPVGICDCLCHREACA